MMNISQHFQMLLAIVLLATSATGWGLQLQSLLALNKKGSADTKTYAFFYGQAILATTIFIVSWFFAHPYNTLILFIPLIFGIWFFYQKSKFVGAIPKLRLHPLSTSLLSLLVLLLTFIFLSSFHRPSEWDEISYHFPALRELAAGDLKFPLLQSNPYNYFYQPFSTFYGSLPYASASFASFAYNLSGNHMSVAHIINTANFFIFLLLLNSFLKSFFKVNPFTRVTVGILLTLNSGVLILLTTGLVDLNTSIYQTLAILLLLQAQREKRADYLFLSLLSLGAAFGNKFTTAYLLPVYIPWLLIVSRKLVSFTRLSLAGLFFVTIGGGVWYLKNLLLHANPVYPLYLGHSGVSASEYDFIIKTVVTDLRQELTLQGLFSTLYTHYRNDAGTIVLLSLVAFKIVFLKFKLSKPIILLLLSGISVVLINLTIGSQIVRFALLFPLLLHLIFAKFFHKNKALLLLVLSIVLFSQFQNVVLRSHWQAKINEMPYIFSIDHEASRSEKLGCLANVYSFCVINCGENDKMLNLWDPYAAVYYQDVDFFTYPPISKYDEYKPPENTTYLYVNMQWKMDFLSSLEYHSDIKPVERLDLEQRLINQSEEVFSENNCLIYEIAEI